MTEPSEQAGLRSSAARAPVVGIAGKLCLYCLPGLGIDDGLVLAFI